MSTTNKQELLAQLIEKAFSYQLKNQHDAAIQIFQKMINIEPDNSDAHHFLGVSYMEQKKFNKAIPELEYALKLKPELDYYYCNLGFAYWKNNQMQQAVDCLRKGMKLNNNNKFIHINLAQTLLDMGKIEDSLAECRKCIDKYPDDFTLFFFLILIEYRLCKKNIVLAELNKVVLKKNITIDQWLDRIPENDDKHLFTKGVLFILLKNFNQGLEYLKKAEKIVPGAGWIFTYKIISQIKHHYGPIIYESKKQEHNKLCKSDYQGIITMNDLGISGRLGHQIFYYLGLKQYAKKHNLYIETSDWIGRYLFEGCDEPLISGVYDTIDSKNPMFIRSINDSDPPQKKFNLKNGCFRYSGDEKKFAQNTLQLLPYWRKKLEPFFFHIKKDKKTLITIHIRRGDFLMEGFYVPSNDLYLDWLESIWRNIEKPVLYIASDEVKAVKSDFAKFNPFTSEDFEEKFYFDDFLTDFYIISQSDIAVLGQSSFSRIAAMSNKKSSQFYWANPKTNKIESIDKSQTASFLKCLVV